MRIALILGCIILCSACFAPIRPQGESEAADLDACYLWNYPNGAPTKGQDYFILSDGKPSFRSLKWIPSIAQAQGCDIVFPLTYTTSGWGDASWNVDIFSARSGKKVANARAEGANFSHIALAIFRAVKRGTPAYQTIIAEREGSSINRNSAPENSGKEQDSDQWWRK